MNIVHWGKYYPPDMGGIESVTASLARGAVAAGHRVTVVCFAHKAAVAAEAPAEEIDAGVRVLRAPMELYKASQPLGRRYLRQLLHEGRRADVVHLHAPNMLAALAAALLGRGPRLVVHWHSDVVGKGLLARLLRPLESAMLRRADSVVCTSDAYAAGSATLAAVRHKVRIVPIGVADAGGGCQAGEGGGPLPPALAARLQGRRLVLAVGRLVPYKGFEVLIDAAASLPADALVVIVGTGPLAQALQQRVQAAGVADRVVLAGRVDDASLAALFRRAALFCLPSVERSEAFGVVLAEAMSYGLPIVATQIDGSGVPWVNAHGVSGLNVPVGDPQALAQACGQILQSAVLRAQLSTGARQRYLSEFTEQLSTSRMLAVYGPARSAA